MGVDAGISMPRKVLAASAYAIGLHPVHEIACPGGNHFGRAPERSHADYRILRIAVDVQNRREVQIDSQRSKLKPHRSADFAAWYGLSSLMIALLILGLALYGFRASLAGRKVFGDEFLQD